MEPTRIGRFIAERRKALGLTQRQLAEQLSVSDKAVSKWETGRGLPDVLLMPPLCAALGITVNDLLSGERVGEGDYRKKAEENMKELMRENAENRPRLLQSIACGGVTVVAVLHDLHLAFRYATHLVFMKDGEVVAQGEPRDVVTADLIERVFSVPCRIIDDPETGSPLVIPTR